MENKVTVVLADANEEFRTMLRQHMEAAGEFLVVGSTDSGLSHRGHHLRGAGGSRL